MNNDRAEKIFKLEEVMAIIEANPRGNTVLFKTESAYCIYGNDVDPDMLIFHIILSSRANFQGYLVIRYGSRAFSHFGTSKECDTALNVYIGQEAKIFFHEKIKRADEKKERLIKERERRFAAARVNATKEAALIKLPNFSSTREELGDSLIYVLTCQQTQKKYVGRTNKTADKRFKEHCALAKKGKGYLLHQEIRRYGPDSFDIKVLYQNLTFVEAVETEALVIKKFQTVQLGLNMSEGGWEELSITEKKNAFREFSEKHKDLLAALSLNMALLWDKHEVIRDANEIRIQENKPRYERKYLWGFPEVQEVMDQELIEQWKTITNDKTWAAPNLARSFESDDDTKTQNNQKVKVCFGKTC